MHFQGSTFFLVWFRNFLTCKKEIYTVWLILDQIIANLSYGHADIWNLKHTYIRMSLSLRRNIIETWNIRAGGLRKPVLCVEPSPEMLEVYIYVQLSNHASNYCNVLKFIFSFTITCQPNFILLNLAWLQFGWCSWNLPGESSFENLVAPLNFDCNVEKNILHTWSTSYQPAKSREGWSGHKLWEKTLLMQFWSDRRCTTYQRWSIFIETPWHRFRKVEEGKEVHPYKSKAMLWLRDSA